MQEVQCPFCENGKIYDVYFTSNKEIIEKVETCFECQGSGKVLESDYIFWILAGLF